jgi:hypothetical protein
MDELEEDPQFDFEEAANLCGLSGLQREFVRAKLKGANNTQAARAAGYSGDDEQLRSAGHRAYSSPKVQSFLSLAQREGYGVPDEPGDTNELMRILWKHARGEDKSHAIRAAEVLHRLKKEEAEVRQCPDNIETLLERIGGIEPAQAVLIAQRLAIEYSGYGGNLAVALAQGWKQCRTCGSLHHPRVAEKPVPEQVSVNGAEA